MPTTPIEDFNTALIGVITATWADVQAANLYRAQQINRANWENLINGSVLEYPYGVIDIQSTVEEEWAMDSVYSRVQVDIYKIEKTGATAAGTDITLYMYNQLLALKMAIVNYTGPEFQAAGDNPVINVATDNPANKVFFELQSKAFGGLLSCNLLYEEG